MASLTLTPKGIDESQGSSGHRTAGCADLCLGLVLVGALALPVLLSDRAYFGDWGNHLFLLEHQTRWLESHLAPTYFLHTAETAAFYPHFLFYGGTLYWLVGCLATVVGTALAYKVSSVVAMAVCYFGALWLTRQTRVSGLTAHLPAMALTAGSYYLSKQYLDGGWPEFVALSMMPMVVASAVALLTGVPRRLGALVAFVTSSVVLTGSHAISAEYGMLFLVSLAAAVAIACRGSVRMYRQRVLFVLLLAALSVGANAWFLVPAVAYAHLTVIGQSSLFEQFDSLTATLNHWRVIFHPGRVDPRVLSDGGPRFYVQQPVVVVVSALAIGGVLQRKAGATLRRTFWALVILLIGYLGLVLWEVPWRFAPEFLLTIQFRFRLHPYVAYCIAGLLIIALLMVQRTAGDGTRRWLLGVLTVATMVSYGAGVWQAWSAPRFLEIPEILGSGDSLPPIDYSNCPAPCPWVNTDYRMVERLGRPQATSALPVDLEEARRGTLTLVLPGGEVTLVNVAWSPLLSVASGPATIQRGAEGLVLVDTRNERPGVQTRIELRTRWTGPTRVGAAISLACLVALMLTVLKLRGSPSGTGDRRPARSAGVPNVMVERQDRCVSRGARTPLAAESPPV